MFLLILTATIALGTFRIAGLAQSDFRFVYALWVGFTFGGGMVSNQVVFVYMAMALMMIELAVLFRTRLLPWAGRVSPFHYRGFYHHHKGDF